MSINHEFLSQKWINERFRISINNYISPKTKKILLLIGLSNSTPIIKSYNSLLGQGWIDSVTNTIHSTMFVPNLNHSWQRDYSNMQPVIEKPYHETNNLNSEFVPDDQPQSRMINPTSRKPVIA